MILAVVLKYLNIDIYFERKWNYDNPAALYIQCTNDTTESLVKQELPNVQRHRTLLLYYSCCVFFVCINFIQPLFDQTFCDYWVSSKHFTGKISLRVKNNASRRNIPQTCPVGSVWMTKKLKYFDTINASGTLKHEQQKAIKHDRKAYPQM